MKKKGSNMKTLSVFLSGVILSITTGCASMFNGGSEMIYLRSNEPNTTFYANARELGTGTTAVTSISKKQLKKTTLHAKKPGYNSVSTPIETEFDSTSLLGIFVDYGVFSIICVDWLGTGAITKASQNDYILTPRK